jgi:formimidoylglutamate deiminase
VPSLTESGWLPDLVYVNGGFESGVAIFATVSGEISRFSSDPGDLRRATRLPNQALLPGLVNVHSHSFQRAIRARTEHRTGAGRDSFWTWREAMYHAANLLSPEDIFDVARMAFLEMLASGITAVGEFHYLHNAPDGGGYQEPNLLAQNVLRAARETGIRIALLRTAYARAGWQKDPNPGQARFITKDVESFVERSEALRESVDRDFARGCAWVGIAPHSVRAVPIDYLLRTVEFARSRGMKIHMHVSEQPAEIEACQAEYGVRPVELLNRHQVLAPDFTGIHAIHITREEIRHLVEARALIGACPTTERNLGDGIGPTADWFSAGVETCLGTDSNVQINLLEDARELEYHLRSKHGERVVLAPDENPESLARCLFLCATEIGARSIGAPGGSLAPGKPADFFTVDLNDFSIAGARPSTLLSHLIFSAERTAISEVYVGGKPVIRNGRHELADQIVERFSKLQARLWKQMP